MIFYLVRVIKVYPPTFSNLQLLNAGSGHFPINSDVYCPTLDPSTKLTLVNLGKTLKKSPTVSWSSLLSLSSSLGVPDISKFPKLKLCKFENWIITFGAVPDN